MRDEPPPTPARPSRRRRWLAVGLGAFAVLVALRLAAPLVVAAVLASRLSAALGVPVTVGDVDLALWAGELSVTEIVAAPPGETSGSRLRIQQLRAEWTWRELFRGLAAVDLELSGVDATFDLQQPWPAQPAPPDEGASPGLGPLRVLSLSDGALEVVLARGEAPIVVLRDLSGRLDGGGADAQDGSMTARFSAAARTGESGGLTLEGSFSPSDPSAAWTARVAVRALDLRPLNPLFQKLVELDVEHGWLSVEGELTASLGRLRGQIRPAFEQLRLLGRDERSVRHPMAEALFTSMLASAELPIDIDRAVAFTGGLTLDEAFRTDAMSLLTRVILQGFTRRLSSLVGHDATIGGLEVDFPAGRLSFSDITVFSEDNPGAEPFAHIARMDVIVEPSVVDPAIDTYKSIALVQPRLLFLAGAPPFDPEWQEKVSAMPYPTDSMLVMDGRVEYRDERTSPPTSLVLSSLAVRAENLGRARETPEPRDATVGIEARLMGESPLTLTVAFSPGVAPLDGAIALVVAPLPLVRLNELLRGRFGVDVSSGTFGVKADLDAHGGRVTGTVIPTLAGITVLGRHELDVEHPLREWLVERRLKKLDGARLALDLDADDLVRDLPRALRSAALQAR